MIAVGVVVLNYKKAEDTIACVDSLLRQEGVDVSVVIVDNGSQNGSYEQLRARYADTPSVAVLAAAENLGYARGNNIGIRYLQKCNIHHILVANPDTVFSSPAILRQLAEQTEESVGLLVPIIRNPDGTLDQRVSYQKKYLLLRMIKAVVQRQFYRRKKAAADTSVFVDPIRDMTGVLTDRYAVSGSAFLLTPAFLAKYDQLFPQTFLYFEEWATILYLHKAGLKSKIVATDPILHAGGGSTPENMRGDTEKKRRLAAASARKVFPLIFLSRKQISRRFRSREEEEQRSAPV